MSNKSKFTPIQIAEFEHLFNGWVLFLKNDLHCFKDAQVEVMKEHVSETDLPKDVDIPEFAQQSFLHALNKFYIEYKEEYDVMFSAIEQAKDIINPLD